MNNNLSIKVLGPTNSGKSTICYLLKEFLIEKGFDIEFDGGIDYSTVNEFDEKVGENIFEKTNSLSNRITIKLNEITTIRPVKV